MAEAERVRRRGGDKAGRGRAVGAGPSGPWEGLRLCSLRWEPGRSLGRGEAWPDSGAHRRPLVALGKTDGRQGQEPDQCGRDYAGSGRR